MGCEPGQQTLSATSAIAQEPCRDRSLLEKALIGQALKIDFIRLN